VRASAVPAALLALGALSGCGGGMPLLHPARTLPPGEVRAATGVSGNFALGGLADSLTAARNDAATNPNVPGTPGSDPTYAKGALVSAAVGPGIAPFVSARVGIGAEAEGGVSYTGRGVRIDLRRSFDLDRRWSISIGAGGSAAFYGSQQGGDLPAVDLGSLHGYGADVPLLAGWQSRDDLYMAWFGPRGGWEHVEISTLTSEPRPPLPSEPISLSANRFYAGGVAGAAVGFRHVHVAIEVDVGYQTVSGTYNATQVTVNGVSATPATALWWTF
jgi:hypothetical protein